MVKIIDLEKDIKEKTKELLKNSTNIPIYKSNKNDKNILVLSGGGIKGIAYIGALQALKDLKYLENIKIFAAASVGALIVSIYILGYEPKEMYEFIKQFDLSKMKSIDITNVLNYYGLDTGSNIEYVIKRLIRAKNYSEDITLRELFDHTNKKMIFTTVCVNNAQLCYLSHDTHPFLPLYKAIRMSMSIPIYYTPVKYDNKLYIDGGCIDNYPIHLFNNRLEKVIGIYLVDRLDEIENIKNIETYILRMVQCLMKGATFNSKKGYDKWTIDIHLESLNLVDYGISLQKKRDMYDIGYKTVINRFN